LSKCEAVIVESKAYTCTFKLSVEQTLCLNGFGVPLVEGLIPEFRKDFRGSFKRGLLCSVKYIIEDIKYCDKRWLIINESQNILQTLFSEAWATKHQDEKIILDFIISCLKKVKITNMPSYLINVEELRKRLGLKANRHKNPILTSDEQNFIEDDYKDILEQIRKFSYFDYQAWKDLINHMKDIQLLCKLAKPYSDLCKELVNERLTLVFKNQKKNKKVPVEKLILDKKEADTIHYVKAFNPCRAAGCKAAFRVGSLPQNDEERNRIRVSLREWSNAQKGNNAVKGRLSIIESWYFDVLGL
jgi:hypothetical protein